MCRKHGTPYLIYGSLCRISRSYGYRCRKTYPISTIATLDVSCSYNGCLRCDAYRWNCVCRPNESNLKLLVELLYNTLAAILRLVGNHYGCVDSNNCLCAGGILTCHRIGNNSAWLYTIGQAIPLAQVFSHSGKIFLRCGCDSNWC